MNKIALINIWFGPMPIYLSMFIESAKKNTDIDFIFFSSWEELPVKGNNVYLAKLNLEDFNNIAIKKGVLNKGIKYPYKLCDLKPAWSHILEDYLKNYRYVGYVDIDMILGNISVFFTPEILDKHDIVTITEKYMSGALTIYKNNEKMREKYQMAKGWQHVFNDDHHWAFDEFFNVDYANKELKTKKYDSFTDVIFQEASKGKIKLKKGENIAYEKRPGLVIYNNGRIVDDSDREYICYHFVCSKHFPFFVYPKWKIFPNVFYVNKLGFYKVDSQPLRLFHIFFNFFYLRQVIKSSKSKISTIKKLFLNFELNKIMQILKSQI